MLYLFKKNIVYLTATFLLIFYPMIVVLIITMLLDPSEKAFALDKLTHFGAFSVLTYFIYFILSYQGISIFLKMHRVLATIISGLMIGAAIEIIQFFMPDRSTNVFDMMANLFGILFTLLLIKYSPHSIKRLKRYGI